MAMSAATLDPPSAAPWQGPIECRVVDRIDSFAQSEADWNSLSPVLPSPMETFGWALSAAAALNGEQRAKFVLAHRDGTVCGIAQLALQRRRPGGRLEMLGMARLNEPGDFAYADQDALSALVRGVVRLGRPILLGRLRAESPTIALFERHAQGRGTVLVRPRASCPVIALDESWREPESHLSSRRRSDYRRALKRAQQQGSVQADVLAPQPDEVERLLEIAFDIEARSWKGAAGTALASDPIRGRFIREFAAWASRAGILRIALLRIGEKYAAMQIAAEQNNALWLLKIGFDPEFANCSPGNLLLAESLRYGATNGLSSLEFLGTVEPWTQVWTECERRCVSLRYYPYNLRGAMTFAAEGTATLVRRLKSKPDQSHESDSGECSPPSDTDLSTTAAPRGSRGMLRCLTGRAKAPLHSLARLAARSYIAGDLLDDALVVAKRLADQGSAATVGFWDGPKDSPATVLCAYREALDGVAAAKLDAYLSIKLPSLGYSPEMLAELATKAAASGVGLHFDALGPETVDRTWAAISALPDFREHIGCTLPGSWQRSPADADWAVEHGLAVRVVKGQWPDPAASNLDPRAGYLGVVRRLAGRARRVAVASHDLPTARQAIEILRAAGTPTTLELLYGLPSRRQIELARELGVPVRIYVPFGSAYLPYCVAQMKRNPRIAWWLLRDALRR